MLAGSLIAGDFYLIRLGKADETIPLLAAFLLSSFFFLFTVTYLFHLAAYYSNTSKNMIVNAFLLSLKNLPQTVFMCILNLSPLIIFVLSPSFFVKIGFIWLLIGFSAAAFCNSGFLLRIFERIGRQQD